ncbi:MAG TPA: aminotransferase class I/II-fold pyridoxal phosphate-dependent enzyme [Acidimicrobiales bacterium]|nr:aminotransferase class I/II-fold pyridoxal phosphate-dependent enzyme [Acidimicrobiales bacterium]
MSPAGGFVPPPYPYSRLSAVATVAERHPGGMVDLSIGTPCDPPPDAVVSALGSSGTERGYPASVGSPALRQAAAGWIRRRFGVDVDSARIGACVGTKEFVATAAWFLRLRSPERDTVLAPAIAYPTYALSAQLAGCRAVAVPETPAGGLDLGQISEQDAARAVMLWVNSPANPTGSLTDLGAAASWGRARDVPVFSDECYAEFTWAVWPPPTILHHGTDGLVAVHSLSKRSNLAGVRVGFYAGDADIVSFLSQIRQHAGLMVPGPVQAAAVVALDDDVHVEAQRHRYRRRLARLADALTAGGLEATVPAGTFYLWVAAPAWALAQGRTEGRDGAWVLAEALAEAAGTLVSPGEFYGEAGAGHVRIAVVQPDERIDLVARRLAQSSDPRFSDR